MPLRKTDHGVLASLRDYYPTLWQLSKAIGHICGNVFKQIARLV
jgi:hypothetical protein